MNLTIEHSHNQFYLLLAKIDAGEIQSCDGFEVTEPNLPLIKHYFTFAYTDEQNVKWFFITMSNIGKVKLLNEDDILSLAIKYKFTINRVIAFVGNASQRQAALHRGFSVLGKPYRWIGANCENLLNYIQTGRSKSKQTRIASGISIGAGTIMLSSKNVGLKTLGIFLIIIGLIALAIEWFCEKSFGY